MQATKIDWADCVCNPVVGCTFGCNFCYARKMNARFGWIPKFDEPQFFPERLKALYSKTPKIIFMDSMSDIADWKQEWTDQIYRACEDNPRHTYLFLTKRPDWYLWGENRLKFSFYYGVSAINQIQYDSGYIAIGKMPNWAKTFISIEPIHEPIAVRHPWVFGWVIIGAETGNRKGKVVPEKKWIDDIVTNCQRYKIPVFMKESLRALMGADFIQQYPWKEGEAT
jgi:protein gp37